MSLYCIGSFFVKVESDLERDFLERDTFKKFLVSEGRYDILWKSDIVHSDSLVFPAVDISQDGRLNHCIRTGIDSPLLRSHAVHKYLDKNPIKPEALLFELRPHALTFFNFINNSVQLFCDEDYACQLKEYTVGSSMLSFFLPKFAALMLHGSAIARNSSCAVFLAPDEGGKTTTVKLAPSGTILCDDQIVICKKRDGFFVYGTPWGTINNAKLNFKLGALFLLEKASFFKIVPLNKIELIQYLFAEHKKIFDLIPISLRKKAFQLICEISHSVPTYKVYFEKHHIDWDAIDLSMSK